MAYCTECGQECTVIEVDFGIGAYEYWGATGYDSQICDVSDCCEADTQDTPPSLIEPDPNLISESDIEGGEQS